MDIDLCQFNKNYFYNLSKYNNILNQRNKLLKVTSSESVLKETISIWNEQLADVGSKIITERIKLIEKLKVHANNIQKYLTDGNESLEITYAGMTGEDDIEIKQKLITAYEKSLEKDMNLGYTTVGPHRDDMKIVLNDIDVRHFGSQGQQRTVALALKLAELEVFKDNIGEYPVLLLDDVLSELDTNRKIKLLNHVKNIQTIVTCTSFNYDIPCTKFVIENGNINTTY